MVFGVIPARIGSSRFPKKILAPLAGKPMVAHAIEQAQKSEKLDKVIVAIDSEETKEALADFDFEIIMTDSNHISGTDRIAEVVKNIDDVEIVINIQGDEPLTDPKTIDGLITCYTLAIPFFKNTLISTFIFTGLIAISMSYLDQVNKKLNYYFLNFSFRSNKS